MNQDNNSKDSFFKRLIKRNRNDKEVYEQLKDEQGPKPELNVQFSDSRNIILAGLIVVGVFFGIGGLWVTFAEITGAVIANGEIRVDAERKTVQHLEGGIVRKILVRDGDHVDVGQPLLVFDGTQIAAVTDHTKVQMAAAKNKEARLIAERDFLDQPQWPAKDSDIPAEKLDELQSTELKIFNSNREALENRIALLNKQISQINEQITSINDRLDATQNVINSLQEELDAKLVLFEEKFIDKTRILELRRTLAEREGIKAQFRGTRAELYEKIAEFELRINALKAESHQVAVAELSKTQQEIFAYQQKLLPLEDARRRQVVTAPVGGVVVALQIHSEDGVLSPGEPILDIVPQDSPMVVECRIAVTDIVDVQKGQVADVQLSAFPSRTTPRINGKVVYVSADRLLQETRFGPQPTYIVHVELNRQELIDNNLYLTAGMPAAVFIRTKPRTVLDYLLEPLKENFDRALREK